MPDAGENIYPEDFEDRLDDLDEAVVDINELWPKCRVATPSVVSVPTNTEQPLQFDVAPYNVGPIHPGGTNTTLTMPRDGVYLFTAYCLWTTISTLGIRRLTLRRNGVADMVALTPEGLGGVYVPINVSAAAFFNAGETVQAIVWQESTLDLDVAGWLTANFMGTVP